MDTLRKVLRFVALIVALYIGCFAVAVVSSLIVFAVTASEEGLRFSWTSILRNAYDAANFFFIAGLCWLSYDYGKKEGVRQSLEDEKRKKELLNR